jgi:hypothetical protein
MQKAFLISLLAAVPLFAGGFYLTLGNPEANPEARKLNAAIVVQAAGCHDPAAAEITATAVGLVNGERRTIPLKLTKLSQAGAFAVAQQWPREGKWVIEISGRNAGMFTNTLVTAGPDGVDRLHARYAMKAFTPADIDSLLD